ncbi:MAG: class I SAM-dependent methyltransferase [Bacilli bacterium]|nr:class I SAM-dependent methyltransferase [Bacilli bacterium]
MRQNIYDNKEFYQEYDKMRKEKKGNNANDLIEIPNFRHLVPNVENKKILDLGCGYGENCKYYKELGASKVLGIDLSTHMIAEANKSNKLENIEYKVMPMEEIDKIEEKFDIVLSSLAFHYIKDFKKLIKDIYNLLNKDGYLIFSQEHPLVTSTILSENIKSNHQIIDNKWYLLLADYNRIGLRKKEWNDQIVEKYHRNFSEIINTLIEVGFKIDNILEPTPSEDAIKKVPKYIYQYDRPYFLFVKVHK